MSERKTLTAEEKERRIEERAEAARRTRQASVQREKKLRQDKKLNVYNYMAQLTGCEDLSIAKLKKILSYEYTISYGPDIEDESLTIQNLIENAASSERRIS